VCAGPINDALINLLPARRRSNLTSEQKALISQCQCFLHNTNILKHAEVSHILTMLEQPCFGGQTLIVVARSLLLMLFALV
jgi:hypothetical protein